jgi:hypothetical protein
MQGVHFLRQMEVCTAEKLVHGSSRFGVEIHIAKLKKYKLPGSGQFPAELIQAGGEMFLSAIHELINSIWTKEELPGKWKESIIVPIYKMGDETDCNNYCGISVINIIQNFIEYPLKVKYVRR